MTKLQKQKRDMKMFVADLELEGFNNTQIKEELVLLRTCEEEIDYIKASRKGKTIRLSRGDRKAIYLSYDIWVA